MAFSLSVISGVTQKTFTVDTISWENRALSKDSTILDVKKALQDKQGIPPEQVVLIFDKTNKFKDEVTEQVSSQKFDINDYIQYELEDDKTCSDYGIKNGDELIYFLQLRGYNKNILYVNCVIVERDENDKQKVVGKQTEKFEAKNIVNKTVMEIKEMIYQSKKFDDLIPESLKEDWNDFPIDQIPLMYDKAFLTDNDKRLTECKINGESTVHMILSKSYVDATKAATDDATGSGCCIIL